MHRTMVTIVATATIFSLTSSILQDATASEIVAAKAPLSISKSDGPPSRWQLDRKGGILWKVNGHANLPHADHMAMSGQSVDLILEWQVEADGAFKATQVIRWPMLRTIPDDTHASLQRKLDDVDVARPRVDGEKLSAGTTLSVNIHGVLSATSRHQQGITLTRTIFPCASSPAIIDLCRLQNTSDKSVKVQIPAWRKASETQPEDGVFGKYVIEEFRIGEGSYHVAPSGEVSYALVRAARKLDDAPYYGNPDAELASRTAYVTGLDDRLVLETPDPVLNRLFAFSKLRATESIFSTRGGLMHGPGGYNKYLAALWANDQAEYVNPFFPFLGNNVGNESALNCYRHFARYMTPDYRPIPNSIIAEGRDIWDKKRDRGDAAMIASGASRFCLASGNPEWSREIWPLIEWCLEYCHQQKNSQGVIASDTDELEGRFGTGSANLCTSSLYYDALISSAYLAEELGLPSSQIESYREKSKRLRQAIKQHFEAEVEGFETYAYYEGNTDLRSWICIPLTVGIHDRLEGTVDALFSDRLWTKNGLLTQARTRTVWDRSTLYALRGIMGSTKVDRGLQKLQAFSRERLLGKHVPYVIEAYPEQNQSHLSAESGLYCRIFIEGVLGIRPAGLHTFDCTPRLPTNWPGMALRNVQAFGSAWDLNVTRDGDKIRVAVTDVGGRSLYNATLPEGSPHKIDLLSVVNSENADENSSQTSHRGSTLTSADSGGYPAVEGSTINVFAFGAVPDDEVNDAEALRRAVAACRDLKVTRLIVPPGQYLLADAKAIELQEAAMRGQLGTNPQEAIFRSGFRYTVGLDFNGIKNLTIEANGAELLCDGWMEPISLIETENITIDGLSIDYKRPPNSAGEIIALGDGTVDVKFFDWCPVFDNINFCRFMVFDNDHEQFCGPAFYGKKWEKIGQNTLRLHLGNNQLRPGRVLIGWHGFHFRPAILLYKAKDTELNDVSIHAQPGMGIVGHLSENITMNRLSVVPKPGRYSSSNTDATHFASIYGEITFDHCLFGGQGDDSTNVHIYYTDILDRLSSNRCQIGMAGRYETHSVMMDHPKVGDRLTVTRKSSLEEIGVIEVKSIDVDEATRTTVIAFSGELPEDIQKYYLANISALPKLTFTNCRVQSHRARSVLCKTRDVLIENNVFEKCTGTAIHVGAEGNWLEGSTAQDVVIRNNRFVRCGFGGLNAGVIDGASAVAIHVNSVDRSVPGLHKRILIENNEVIGGIHAIAVKNAEDVIIQGNVFRGIQEEPVIVGTSNNVEMLSNIEADIDVFKSESAYGAN